MSCIASWDARSRCEMFVIGDVDGDFSAVEVRFERFVRVIHDGHALLCQRIIGVHLQTAHCTQELILARCEKGNVNDNVVVIQYENMCKISAHELKN